MKAPRIIGFALLGALLLTAGAAPAQDNARESYAQGVELALKGNYPEAKAAFAQALKTAPFFSPAKGSLEIVEDVINKKLDPKAAHHLFKAATYAAKQQWDLAIAARTKAIELSPNYAVAYLGRGVNYQRAGQPEKAIKDFDQALKLNPKLAAAYSARGTTHLDGGRVEMALADYNQALELDPNDAATFFNRGNIYLVTGQFDPAIKDFDQALKVNPKFAAVYLNKAAACEKAGRKPEALEALRNFIANAQPDQIPQIQSARQKIMELSK